MPDTTIDLLCNEFRVFVASVPFGQDSPVYLAAYIAEWAFASDRPGNYPGVLAVNGDYELFLQVVVAIIARWSSDPHYLYYVDSDGQACRPRQIPGVVDPNGFDQLGFINKHSFQGIVFDLMTIGRKTV